MSFCLRVVIIVAFAYAGWQTASVQFRGLPESGQLMHKSDVQSQYDYLNEEPKSLRRNATPQYPAC